MKKIQKLEAVMQTDRTPNKQFVINKNTREYQLLNSMLTPGEEVNIEVTERRLGGANFLGVAHAYLTSSRIIIIRRYVFSVHKSIKVIKYAEVSDLQIECGLLFCKIHFAVKGEPTTESEESGHKWLMGLRNSEAIRLINHMNQIEVKNALPVTVLNREGLLEE